jgi:hypothetical protein
MMMVRKLRLDRRAFAIAALLCLGLLPIMLMMYHVRSTWIQIPFWDEWFTPGSQFESWCRGSLTLGEMFSQHNESRKFFPRLLYFAMAMIGGWDVRKEMDVVFLEVCLLSLLLWRLLRRTPGGTSVAVLATWVVMMFLCFSPVQFENFLYGIQLEPFFVGLAVVAVAAVNLSELSFRSKTLTNLSFALVSTYTYANGMVLWPLAFPLTAPSDSTPRRCRVLWLGIYLLAASIAIGFYFVGYERPSYHPPFASFQHHEVDLAHYLVLWIGSYFASDYLNPLIAGIVALGLFAVVGGGSLILLFRNKEWRTFYPWALIGAYAGVSGIVTAFARLSFGVQQALDSRYTVFSLFFYLALVGGSFAFYCALCGGMRNGNPAGRACFLTHAAWLFALAALCWTACYQKNVDLLARHREQRVIMSSALKWMDVIPDNPDLALVFPYVNILKNRARILADHHLLRLPFIKGPLAAQVRQSPPDADGSAGRIETCAFDSHGSLFITGWAWSPGRNQHADSAVIGCKDAAGNFKPICVLSTGVRRDDLRERLQLPKIEYAGFSRIINPANLPTGDVAIEGWAIDVKDQKAWPLASSLNLKQSR